LSNTRCHKCKTEGTPAPWFLNWGYQRHTLVYECPSCHAQWSMPPANDASSPPCCPDGRYVCTFDDTDDKSYTIWHPEGCLVVLDEMAIRAK